MEKLPLIELAELNKSIIFRDSFQDIFSIADLDGGMEDVYKRQHRRNSHMFLKEFSKSRLVGKMKYIRHLLDSCLRSFQKNFRLDDQGIVYPLISRFTCQFLQYQ